MGSFARNPTGRLIEARLEPTMTLADAQAFAATMARLLTGIPGRAVVIADLFQIGDQLFARDVMQTLRKMLTSDNPKIERTAVLVRGGPGFQLQVDSLLMEAATAALSMESRLAPTRRTFRDRHLARSWLSEVLAQPGEQDHVAEFTANLG